MSPMEMNRKLVELFDLPPDTVSATLRIKAHVPPMLTVTRMVLRDGQIGKTTERFRLVPEKVGAGETAKGG